MEIQLCSLAWSIDRGDVQGPGSMAPSSAFKRLVAWQWNSRTIVAGSCTFVQGAGNDVVPEAHSSVYLPGTSNHWGLTLLYFLFHLFPCYRPLLVGPKSHLSSQSEEVSKVFYRPDHVSDWSITHHVTISGNIISCPFCRFIHLFLTQLICTFKHRVTHPALPLYSGSSCP